MKISEYIKELQNLLSVYGDAEIYRLDEDGCRESFIHTEVHTKIISECSWDPEKEELIEPVTGIDYYEIW